MTAIVAAAAAGLAVMIACGLALWDQARCHHDETCPHAEDAITLGCKRCEDAQPLAWCTCLGQCGKRDCAPRTYDPIASLYPREDVEFLADISGHLEEYT